MLTGQLLLKYVRSACFPEDNMGQIRENKQEVIDVVYNFYADLYKGQNIGLDEIKEYLTHLDLKKLDEEDWTYFDNFFIYR